MSLADVAVAVGGRLDAVPAERAAAPVGTVVTDSRAVSTGSLFVALPGERVDGHDYAASAVAAGALAVLAARPVGVPAVLVDDAVRALAGLAHHVARALPATTVVGVTGSSGKTTTKDLLAGVLGRLGPTVAPAGSFNNEIGHPLTVLRAQQSTRYLVLECSARGLGHIAHLCAIAPPQVSVVLNVGRAHLGEFGSQAVIARSKGELVEALPAAGLAVLNADDPLVAAMAQRTAARVVTFGLAGAADVQAERVRLDDCGRPVFSLVSGHGGAPVAMRLYGEHQVTNALAAAAVALELGLDVESVAEALSEATPASRWRMEVSRSAAGVTVINDAYNANPESMRAALRALRSLAGPRPDGSTRRAVAVLGGMAELGEASVAAHEEIGRLAAELGVDALVTVGSEAAGIARGATAAGRAGAPVTEVADAAAAIALLHEQLRPGDTVLIKASRAAGLERVALAVLADGGGGDTR